MSERTFVLVDQGLPDDQLERLETAMPDLRFGRFASQSELEARIPDAGVVAGRVSPQALERARRLRWVHSWSAGPDGDLHPDLVASPVVMTSSKSNGAVPLAEHAMWLMLTLNRQAIRWIRSQDAHEWGRFEHPELQGLTCGIIGLGFSGQDVALKAKAFHMNVLGVRRTPQATPNVDEVVPLDRLHELLQRSDFVVVTAPRTSETADLLGRAEFSAMKRSAYFVCISRGGIANDEALLWALQSGTIAGAGIDAHGREPLPPDSPFWTAPNVVLTPHNAATTPGTKRRGIEIFTDNLERFRTGRPLRNLVDKHAGY